MLAYWPHTCRLCIFCAIGCLVGAPLAFPLPLCLLIGRTVAGCECFCAFGCLVGAPLEFSCVFACLLAARLPVVHVFWLLVVREALLWRFPTFLLIYWPHFCRLCMFLRFWLLGRHSFRVALPFCLLIGRTFAGCTCFCPIGCSVGAPLAFPAFLLVYWPHVCRLCMFFGCWLFGRCSFGVSLPFCLLIGRTFAGCACFCAFGWSVGAPLAFVCLYACLLVTRLLVGHVFAHLVAR